MRRSFLLIPYSLLLLTYADVSSKISLEGKIFKENPASLQVSPKYAGYLDKMPLEKISVAGAKTESRLDIDKALIFTFAPLLFISALYITRAWSRSK